jgi:hypothetical protein
MMPPQNLPTEDRNLIMSHENAPATKLLATACACCGRNLVDAESVETGIGPECRKRFAIDTVRDNAAREAANALVNVVARKGVSKATCREVCAKLDALGYHVLAARILKRFRTTLPVVPVLSAEELEAARETYRKILHDFAYDNVDTKTLNTLVLGSGAATPAECIKALESLTCPCRRREHGALHHGDDEWSTDRPRRTLLPLRGARVPDSHGRAPQPCFRRVQSRSPRSRELTRTEDANPGWRPPRPTDGRSEIDDEEDDEEAAREAE